MPRVLKNPSTNSFWTSEIGLLAWLAVCVSVISFLFYSKSNETMLYGDAVAHINIARRVFDSKTPGLLQLGTVWLPLPHLLMIPFLISDEMWRRGVGGSIPSLVAYVFGVVGMFRLMLRTLTPLQKPDAAEYVSVHVAAWAGAIIYAANPNLIYMQTTAMGETLYLALFVWSVFYFSEWMRGEARALSKCGFCLAASCLTRYDGWFLTAATMFAVLVITLSRRRLVDQGSAFAVARPEVVKFVVIACAAPALWLAYNGIIYRNPLEFANGPYSAKAIERRSQDPLHPGHPGSSNPPVAGLYFVKAAEANLAENPWLQRIWIGFALVSLAGACVSRVHKGTSPSSLTTCVPLFLLLIPLPFYALSVAYGGVPLFVPAWWPFTHYNDRYGLQLLPAFAAAISLLVYFVLRSNRVIPRLRMAGVLLLFGFVAVSYASIWRATPVTLEEAQINMRSRNQLEAQLAGWLEKLPPDSTLLMYLGDHVGALQQAGIPLKRVINEGNHRVWKQPEDPDGLWERALANPVAYADYVAAFEGDPVWRAVERRNLRELVVIHVTGQARAILYRIR